MKKRKNLGFTLIELLAVVVILGIVLIIAIPKVRDVISSADKSSFKEDANAIIRAIEYKQSMDRNYDPTIINKDNIREELGFIDSKYQSVIITETDNIISVNIVGAGRWDGLIAFGTKDNMQVMTNQEFMVAFPTWAVSVKLATGMIPVYYDEGAGEWKKADVNNGSNSWYNYANQKWANAVTTTSTNRATYVSAAVGTIIPMADINTMWVWVPRYKYKIPTGTGARQIDIVFETKTTPKSTGDAVNTYYTHPAFTFGTTELSGIWVGKFETTGTVGAITIKPDIQSLKSLSVKGMYDAVKNGMQGNTTTYGFTTDSDAHMMKNTEWGVVAYLSNSAYGKYGNSSFTGASREVYLNNSVYYYTGRSMGAPSGSGILTTLYDGVTSLEYSPTGYYTYDGKCAVIHSSLSAPCNTGSVGQSLVDKTLAYGASTTGNITGVYDLSGGSVEYVLGMYKPDPIPATGIGDVSGFSSSTTNSQYDLLTIDSKYYTQYLTDVISTGAVLGDATREVSNWYSDYFNFITAAYPWFIRGRSASGRAGAGIFAFDYTGTAGGANGGTSFHIVLCPNS